MANKKLGLILMVILFIAQLALTGNMIFQQEEIVVNGQLYKFKTAPLDPNDPFRGKYVRLYFQAQQVASEDTTWQRKEDAYILLDEDEEGYAIPKSISRQIPQGEQDFLRVKIRSKAYNQDLVYFDFPFDRFYMEESKAPKAEKLYLESRVDSLQTAYAEVSIYNGEAVIQDVKINGESLKDLVNKSN